MSNGKIAGEAAVNQAVEEPEKVSDQRKFPYEVLKESCLKLFRVTSSTFIGATVGKENGSYSISEMQRLIDEWLQKEVKK